MRTIQKVGQLCATAVLAYATAVVPTLSQESPQPFAKFIKVEAAPISKKPKGVITLTFDDASLTQYENGLRIAKEFGLVGTLFVSTSGVNAATSKTNAWSMNWNQVKEFIAAGWEIGAHTHTHPHLSTLSAEELEQELEESFLLLKAHTGTTPVSFASPFGDFNDTVVAKVMEYHQYHLNAWGKERGVNPIGAADPKNISRTDVIGMATPEVVCGEMLQAAVNQTWTVFIFHQIVDGKPGEYELSVGDFTQMMQCAAMLKEAGLVDVLTVEQAMKLPVPSDS